MAATNLINNLGFCHLYEDIGIERQQSHVHLDDEPIQRHMSDEAQYMVGAEYEKRLVAMSVDEIEKFLASRGHGYKVSI